MPTPNTAETFRGDTGLPGDQPYRVPDRPLVAIAFRMFLPFVLAFLLWGCVWMLRTDAAANDLADLAARLSRVTYAGETPRPVTEAVAECVEELTAIRAGADTGGKDRAIEIVSSVAYRLAPDGQPLPRWDEASRPDVESAYFRRLSILSIAPLGAVLLVLLLPPALFMIRAQKARAALQQHRSTPPSSLLFSQHVSLQRHRQFLDDASEWQLYRRLFFGLLLGLAVVYLLAPIGVGSSMIAAFAAGDAPPVAGRFPAWFDLFEQAPHFAYGFAGYLLYSLTALCQRFYANDLSGRFFVALATRGIFVWILSLVLAGVNPDGEISKGLVFAVGVFPRVGLQIASRATQTSVSSIMPSHTSGFDGIDSIDLWKQTSLSEWGISTAYDLAHRDLRKLLAVTGIDPELLVRAVDRALLLSAMGGNDADGMKKLQAYGIRSASELLLYTRGTDCFMTRWGLEQMPIPIAARKYAVKDDVKAARIDKLEETTELQELTPLLDSLADHPNTSFVVDNRLFFGLS